MSVEYSEKPFFFRVLYKRLFYGNKRLFWTSWFRENEITTTDNTTNYIEPTTTKTLTLLQTPAIKTLTLIQTPTTKHLTLIPTTEN